MRQAGGASKVDPNVLANFPGAVVYRQTNGRTPRLQTIDPTKKKVILLAAGQSNIMSIAPTTVAPYDDATMNNFNVYDGASYPISTTGPLLGCTENSAGGYGFGHLATRVANSWRSSGAVDSVELVSVAIGNTSAAQWASGGPLADRLPATMRRLATRGFVPGTAGLIFRMLWVQGESDTLLGTAQGPMAAALGSVFTNLFGAGFVGKIILPQVSWDLSVTSAAVRAAQASMWNGTTIIDGGDYDTLGDSSRQDTVHFNDAGQAAAAALTVAKTVSGSVLI